jgi:hypothetical protein
MKKIIVSLFIASSLFAGVPLPALAGIDVAAVCDGTVPDAWKRPGGFCDQNDFNNSLSLPSDPGCMPLTVGMIGGKRDVLLLATPPVNPCEPVDDCTALIRDYLDAGQRDRRLVAGWGC